MKVLLVTHFYPPGHLGGTEVLTAGLAQALQANGHTVSVICAEDWDMAPSYRIHHTDDMIDGVSVRRLHFNWMKAPDVFGYLYNNPEVEKHITQLLEQFQPDVMHITSCYSLSASVITAAHRFTVPIVLTATDFWFICARNTLLRPDGSLCTGPENAGKCARCMAANAKVYRWPKLVFSERVTDAWLQKISQWTWLTNQRGLRGMLGKWNERLTFLSQSLHHVERIVTASHFLRKLFIDYGAPPEKISFSAYGLDTRWARDYQTKTRSPQLRIGFIGQIVPFKGPDLLLKAVASLGSNSPIQVKIYGDLTKTPDYGKTLEKLAAGDPRISFLGTFDNKRMGAVLSDMDVLVVPSTWYDFPLVIPSALATRTPVIATDLPGMNELIEHNRNGLLFKRHDWQGLAQQIQRLLDEPDLLDRLGGGIAPVKTMSDMAAEYSALYATLPQRFV